MKKADKITMATRQMSKKEVNAKPNKMFMTKSKDTSQKAVQRAAKALEHRVAQLEIVEAPKGEQSLHFPQPISMKVHNKYPMMGDRITLKVGDKILLEEISFQFPLGKAIAITDRNGSGKTTLLRHILQHGEGVTISPKAVIGSYKQMDYQFENDETILSFVKEKSDFEESKIHAVLNEMGFSGNDLKKNVLELSGGEAIRLVLCSLFLGRYNILILDEPANFLDVVCIEAFKRVRGDSNCSFSRSNVY